METKLKTWLSLGVGTALLGTGLTGCGSEDAGEAGEAATSQEEAAPIADAGETGEGEAGEGESGEGEGEGGEGEGGEGEAGADIGTLPLPKRLAFMSGHVEAGLALYRAGEPLMAAPHLLHPVSETHEAERAGLDALGFDASLFEVVSQALDEGRPASEIEPQLAAAEANLAMVAAKAGGDPVEIIRYLMDVIVEEYSIAITDGRVSDAGEYQDAYGFAVVAMHRAQSLSAPKQLAVEAALTELIALWPEDAPIPPENPTPIGQVVAQTSAVLIALQ